MLRIFRVLLAFSLIGLSGCGQVEFTLSNGQHKSLDEFNGRWLVINYWAVWCKPCIEEIPQLNLLNERKNIEVLGVNFDGLLGDELMQQAETFGIGYEMVIRDPSEDLAIERPNVLPATVLIDETGEVRGLLYGPQTVDSILEKLSSLELGE